MKKAQIYLLVFILLYLASSTLAEVGTWTRKSDLPTPRTGLSSSVVNGKIYVIGG